MKNLKRKFKVGEIVKVKVLSVVEYGILVEFYGQKGLIHKSEISNFYIENINNVLNDDEVYAKIVSINSNGYSLSLKKGKTFVNTTKNAYIKKVKFDETGGGFNIFEYYLPKWIEEEKENEKKKEELC